ncbi:hypothetical protein GOBAR_DD04923 [Gossypium barbadense]|nr:hypothetical protein GOBAR_DD04923 [Gossypium barbadense]
MVTPCFNRDPTDLALLLTELEAATESCADRLARMGRSFDIDMVLFDQPPYRLVSILEQDSARNREQLEESTVE